jgi:monofunctional glycosyltransferase
MYQPGKRMSVAHDVLRLPRVPRPLRAVGFAVLLVLLLPYVLTPFYAFGEPVSTVMLWRRMTGQRVERMYVPLARMSSGLPLAVIAAEDGRFCEHHGVDFAGIRDAINQADDLDDVRGGSTVTQQVAKNLFLWPGRSYVRKVLEFPLALWINLILSKRRVMEIYLNIAELGPNGEFGAEAGARRAFGRPVRDLSRYQAALLAAMLPNPHTRDARRPGPMMQRLAVLYVGRAEQSAGAAACLRTH